MRNLLLTGIRRVLCLGAHADDIEIGAGGTLLRLCAAASAPYVRWEVFSATPLRAGEARASAAEVLGRAAGYDVHVHGFEDGVFPAEAQGIKAVFERVKGEEPFDVIFTHHRHDRHQDHRTIADLTWNTLRNHLVLEYEIPKYDGDLGHPNVFVPIDDETRAAKVALLLRHYGSQQTKPWFTESTFDATLRLRGIECRSPTGYAEAFHGTKLVLDVR